MSRALVTGAARRLGRAMALELADRGYDVIVHHQSSAEDAGSLVDEIRQLGRRAISLRADLFDDTARDSLITRSAEALGGPISVLINNASVFEPDTLKNVSQTLWDRHMDSNLRAPVMLTRDFAAQCPRPKHDSDGEPLACGLVVNMIDQRVETPFPDFFSYTLAKSALLTFTRLAAQELAPALRVNGIAPGPTLPSIHQSAQDFARERHSTPLERGANPADIRRALAYLLYSPAVTGQVLYVDGGQRLMPEHIKASQNF